MTEHWKQFTLYPAGCRNQFQPLQVLHTFLPEFLKANPGIKVWHILFEPSALIRFQADEPDQVLASANQLAAGQGLEYEPGDASADNNPVLAYPGVDYHGEAEVYGTDLWEANKQFMQACSVLSLAMAKLDHKTWVFMVRKFIHLYGNALGLNFLEESALAQIWSDRSLELYREHGRS